MRLRNILIVVEDIEKSKKFYHDLFGLDVILDNEGNVILTEGLVLQEKTIWKNFLEKGQVLRLSSYFPLSGIGKSDLYEYIFQDFVFNSANQLYGAAG